MKKILLFIFCGLYSLYNAIFCANTQVKPHIITLFVRELTPEVEDILEKQKLNNIADLKKIEQKKITNIINKKLEKHSNMGIYVVYAGYATYTDHNGQVNFIRKTNTDKFYLLLTQDIKAVYKFPKNTNILSGFLVDPKAIYKYYLLERSEDLSNKIYNWSVKEINIPEDRLIPYDTIIFFINPKNMFVPVGQFKTITGQNLLLPNIYVIKNPDSVLNAFRFLKINKYFSPVLLKYNFGKDFYQKIINN